MLSTIILMKADKRNPLIHQLWANGFGLTPSSKGLSLLKRNLIMTITLKNTIDFKKLKRVLDSKSKYKFK